MVLDDVYRSIGVGDDFLDEHPSVIEISMRRGGCDLLHTPVEVVVAVGDDELEVGRTAGRVPCVAVRRTRRRLADAPPVRTILTASMYYSTHLSAIRLILWTKSHTKRSATTTGMSVRLP